MTHTNPRSSDGKASGRNSDKKLHDMPSSALFKSELLWWPYRSFARFVLPQCHNAATAIQINRKLADDIRDIVRRQQDILFAQYEKFWGRTADGPDSTKGSLTPEAIDDFYEATVARIKAFAEEMTDLQIRSITSLRNASMKTAKAKTDGGENKAAAE